MKHKRHAAVARSVIKRFVEENVRLIFFQNNMLCDKNIINVERLVSKEIAYYGEIRLFQFQFIYCYYY